MKDASKIAPLQLRMPDDLKLWLKHQAVDNHRSVNSEIVHRLEQSRQQQEARDAKPAP